MVAVAGTDMPSVRGWIARVDGALDTVWEHTIAERSIASAVAIAEDDDVVATGELEGLWVGRFSSTGQLQWTTTYDDVAEDPVRGQAIAALDAAVVVVAVGYGPSMAIVLDDEGRETWRSVIDPGSYLRDLWSIAIDETGVAWVAGGGLNEAILAHFRPGGRDLALEVLGRGPHANAPGVRLVDSSGVVIAANDDPGAGWVQRRTREGAEVWRWTTEDPITDLDVDAAGNVLVAGSWSWEDGRRGWVTKLAQDGSVIWAFVAPDNADGSYDSVYWAVAADDLGFVYAGGQSTAGDGVVIKLAP